MMIFMMSHCLRLRLHQDGLNQLWLFLSMGITSRMDLFSWKEIAFLEECKMYQFISRILYKLCPESLLWPIPNLGDYKWIIMSIHLSAGGINYSRNKTTKRVVYVGYWWPTITRIWRSLYMSFWFVDGKSRISAQLSIQSRWTRIGAIILKDIWSLAMKMTISLNINKNLLILQQ